MVGTADKTWSFFAKPTGGFFKKISFRFIRVTGLVFIEGQNSKSLFHDLLPDQSLISKDDWKSILSS